MMLKCFYILSWIGVFKLSFCQREISHESVSEKNYLVYFVQSPYSKADDNAWICAGAIVTPTQILTSAACLTEMQRIYVIAGYKKYVYSEDIDKDKCTSRYKKKVIKISVPKEYNIEATANPPDWISIDIGIAYVKEPYNFSDMSYRIYCSYEPQSITINFDKNNQFRTNQVVAVGWGGQQAVRDTSKEIFLQEAKTTVIEKRICTNLVTSPESMEVVDKYMLCASVAGFKAEAVLEPRADTLFDDCPPGSNGTDPRCIDDLIFTRKNADNISRRSTVKACQNDHGGPLISWIGTQEVMLGVALNGVAKQNFDCTGPRMYVSTAETEKIIKCLLEQNDMTRHVCNGEIENEKYQVVDIDIKWPKDEAFSLPSLTDKISSFQRQGNEEQPLQVRPTKDLGKPDEQGSLRQPVELQYNQNDPKRDSFYLNPLAEQGQGPSITPYQQGLMQQSQINLQNQPPASPYNQAAPMGFFNPPQMEAYNQPQADAYNQQMAPYNPPQAQTYNIPQQGDPYGQPQLFNQPQMESFNPQPADPYNPQPMDTYNLPPMDPYQTPIEPQNQTPADLRNEQQDQMFNKPFNPSQSFYNQPESLKPPQGNTYDKPEMDAYKQAQMDLYGNKPQTQFKQPQANSEMDMFKESQLKLETFSQIQDSFQDPPIQSPFNNPTIETVVQPAASDTYNPLSIISENQPDEGDSFKPAMDEPYTVSPVEPYKHPSSSSSYKKQEPFNPAPVEPYGQPNARQVDTIQSSDQTHVQLGEQHHVQPYDLSEMQGYSLSTDSNQSRTFLRYQQDAGDTHKEQDPSQGDPQTFEQMYSQLHAGGDSILGADEPVTEQTFEEMYKTLHDEPADGPNDGEIGSKGEQTFDIKKNDQPTYQQSINQPTMEQPSFNQPQFGQPSPNQAQFGQSTFNQPTFEQQSFNLNKQPEQQYDRNRNNNMPPATEQHDEVKVRPQMPLDYPDYVSYNKRRRNI